MTSKSQAQPHMTPDRFLRLMKSCYTHMDAKFDTIEDFFNFLNLQRTEIGSLPQGRQVTFKSETLMPLSEICCKFASAERHSVLMKTLLLSKGKNWLRLAGNFIKATVFDENDMGSTESRSRDISVLT